MEGLSCSTDIPHSVLLLGAACSKQKIERCCTNFALVNTAVVQERRSWLPLIMVQAPDQRVMNSMSGVTLDSKWQAAKRVQNSDLQHQLLVRQWVLRWRPCKQLTGGHVYLALTHTTAVQLLMRLQHFCRPKDTALAAGC